MKEKTLIDKTIDKTANGLANMLLAKPKEILVGLAESKLIYTIDLEYLKHTIKPKIIQKYFHNITEAPDATWCSDDADNVHEFLYPNRAGVFYDHIIFRGTPILFKFSIADKNGTRPSNWHDSDMLLMTIRTEKNIKNLRRFLRLLVKESQNFQDRVNDQLYSVIMNNGNYRVYSNRPKRTFDDVFIPQDKQKALTDSIMGFVSQEKWYHEHHIPYHFGILLHGFPGTGKSSVVQAIMNMLPCDVTIAPPGTMKHLFARHGTPLDDYSEKRLMICVCEDVDTNAFVNPRHQNAKVDTTSILELDETDAPLTGKESLGQLLNFMDGVGARERIIYIMTTNHVDDLDPALIRPGRIDLQVEIGYVGYETLDRFCMHHYKKHLPKDFHVKDGLTFSKLQIYVMRKMSFAEFLKECEVQDDT